jgi:osmotically inducible lipoprotein OsmB
MNRKLMLSCALAGTLTLTACADMSDTERRTATGAALGAAAGGLITGDWGWAAGGAAIGAASGYLYDQNKKSQERKQRDAYEQGVKDGQKRK